MRMIRPSRIALIVMSWMIAVTASPCLVVAQASSSLVELLRETQKQSDTPQKATLVWWLPEEFWIVSFQRSGSLDKEGQGAFLKAVRPYLILAAVDGKIGPLGGTDFAEREVLRAKIKVIDRKGASYSPLTEGQLSNDVKNLSAIFQSMFENTLGPMGKGMRLFFFPAGGADGTSIATATAEGEFSVKLGEEYFRWRLPLGSLVPGKVCPEDGERMSGAWKFCPWHGKPLVPDDKASPQKSRL